MIQHSPTENPSHTVERIREILVGRQLEHLEQRVCLLEHPGLPEPPEEPRLDALEARLNSLQQQLSGFTESMRTEVGLFKLRQQEELRGLVHSAKKLEVRPAASQEQLEAKVGRWLTEWQDHAREQAESRERVLVSQLREELVRFRDWISASVASLERRKADREELEQRLSGFVTAARALVDAFPASILPTPPRQP